MRCRNRVSLFFVLILSQSAFADNLIEAPGVNLVRGHCSACHSLDLVMSQRGDRQYWSDLILWMQRTQNLWQIPKPQQDEILDYLAEHYAESDWGRRPNLSPGLVHRSR